MKTPKHATTNYRALLPFIQAADSNDGHIRIDNDPYERLCVENLEYTDYKGRAVYSMAHYYEQYGDLMTDPEITFSVDQSAGAVWPQTYQLDGLGVYQEVFKRGPRGETLYSQRLLTDIDSFLWQWLKNIKDQGFYKALAEMAVPSK